jgi:N-acetylglucosaminyl-diphospho-decaprenol L-rhamnosyltransferase
VSFAAVVVLYRSRGELERMLRTLPDCQLVVVDAGPDDGGAALAAAYGATVIERRENPGFGAACNAGLAAVTEPVTVLLNPDTEDLRDVSELARRAATPGLHAPRLLNLDGSLQRSAHPLPGTLGAFLPAISPWAPVRAEPHRSTTARTVGWAIAACLAARTELIRFDERIHLWAEDMDLCLRARNERIPTVFHPDLAITHAGRHSVGDEPFEALARNRRAVIERRLGRGARRRDDAAQLLTFTARSFKGPRERAQLNALLKELRPGRARASD